MVRAGWGTESSVKNPPKGKFVRGIFYVAAALVEALIVKSRDHMAIELPAVRKGRERGV